MTRGRESNEAFVVIRGEETPADVVAEALSRSWIDRPAIAVRAELRKVGGPDGDGTRVSHEQPLAAAELRRLLGRDAELERLLTGARVDLNIARHQVASLARERASLNRSIGEQEALLGAARRTVAELDRPLVRRRHRDELDMARRQLVWVPRSIAADRAKLARLDVEEPRAAERLADAVTLDVNRPKLMAERVIVRHQLEKDARARGEPLVVDLPDAVVDRLGPRPSLGPAGDLWVDAAGRSAQHRVAFEQYGSKILGREPALIGDDAYASSHRAASQAIERVDRALGRQPELDIETPHRSLGLSL